ncbi:MAG TPA: ribonuclease Z [Sulfolobales archaeon]|nr:ribonuclease Z [Sulfolobales archaeon]
MMKLYFLGTGAGAPTAKRWASSIAISVSSSYYLLDCGEGCQLRMSSLGISPLRIAAIFITHAHGDHVLGLAPLVESMSHHGRRDPLYLVAPQGVDRLVGETIKITGGGVDFDLIVRSPSDGYDDRNISVKGYRVCHSTESWGYRLSIKKKKLDICYTGDTMACREVIEACRGVDILIHEATFTQENEAEARSYMHSTAREAARAALEVGARYLYLTHISSRIKDPEGLVREAREVFKNTRVASDMMVTYVL